jgi:tetratricopeptide (TPR) repeat protein
MTRKLPVADRSTLVQRSWNFVACLVILIGLLGLTAWNLTRSESLAQARLAYMRGELVTGLQQALDHLDHRPWSRDAALLAALCLSRLDYADDAEPYYHRAGRLELSDLQTRAFGLVHGNHRQRAIESYEEILARWPDNVTALRRLAAVQLSENNSPQLESLADRLIRIPNGAAIGYTLRGVVAHNDKNYEQAATSLEKVLELDPDLRLMPLPHPLYWSHLATNLMASGRIDAAIGYLTRGLAESSDASLMNTLGRAYFLQGQFDLAERCYQQAAEWNPNDYLPHYNIGKIELQRHRFEAALGHLSTARKLAPRRTDVLYSLIVVYRLLQQPAQVASVERTIKELRARLASEARSSKDPWPPYAL